eukprot:scaffold4958_cov406-Prasinococcus_capsulatus_cf.AAC.11
MEVNGSPARHGVGLGWRAGGIQRRWKQFSPGTSYSDGLHHGPQSGSQSVRDRLRERRSTRVLIYLILLGFLSWCFVLQARLGTVAPGWAGAQPLR